MKKIKKFIYGLLFINTLFIGGIIPHFNNVEAIPPTTESLTQNLKNETVYIKNLKRDQTLINNIMRLFYPSDSNSKDGSNLIFNAIKNLTIGFLVIYIIYAGAKLLFNRKPEDLKKNAANLGFIILGGIFVYGANRLIGNVLGFTGTDNHTFAGNGNDIKSAATAVENNVIKGVLTFIKAAAFFYAIIMIVVTGFKIVHEGDGEKSRKLIKGLINVVVALFIIKGVDVIYQMAYDANSFMDTSKDFIIEAAKLFAYLYGIVIVVMVFASGYLYLTDGGSGNGFKKASNILINIILSGVVLFGFLLILYQILSEFSTGGDAVKDSDTALIYGISNIYKIKTYIA